MEQTHVGMARCFIWTIRKCSLIGNFISEKKMHFNYKVTLVALNSISRYYVVENKMRIEIEIGS